MVITYKLNTPRQHAEKYFTISVKYFIRLRLAKQNLIAAIPIPNEKLFSYRDQQVKKKLYAAHKNFPPIITKERYTGRNQSRITSILLWVWHQEFSFNVVTKQYLLSFPPFSYTRRPRSCFWFSFSIAVRFFSTFRHF